MDIIRIVWPRTKEDASAVFSRIFWILYLGLGYKLVRMLMIDFRPRRITELAVIAMLLVFVQNLKSRVCVLALLFMVTAVQLFRIAKSIRWAIRASDPSFWAKSTVSILGGFVLMALLVILTRAVFIIREKS